MSSFKKLVRMLNGPTSWSWKSLFSGSGTIRILERLNRFWVKNPAGSWCNLVSNLVRIQGTSPLQASSRISGLPNQDPDPHRVKSRVISEENLVSNPGRIQETSPLQDSTRNSSFPQEKRAFPCRILFRSVTELERKSHGSPLGVSSLRSPVWFHGWIGWAFDAPVSLSMIRINSHIGSLNRWPVLDRVHMRALKRKSRSEARAWIHSNRYSWSFLIKHSAEMRPQKRS